MGGNNPQFIACPLAVGREVKFATPARARGTENLLEKPLKKLGHWGSTGRWWRASTVAAKLQNQDSTKAVNAA